MAIALVLLRHAFDVVVNSAASPLSSALKTLATYAYGGVELFFLLSGFLLGRILSAPLTSRFIGVFYARRALRILPGYALLLVSYWFAVRHAPEITFQSYASAKVPIGAYLGLVQNHFIASLRTLGGLCILLVFLGLIARWNFWHVAENPFAAVYATVSRVGTLFLGVFIALLWENTCCRRWLIAHRVRIGGGVAACALLFLCFAWLKPATEPARWLATVIALLGTWAFAKLSWHLWEARIIELGHKLSYRTP